MTNEEAMKILDTQWPKVSFNQAAAQNNYSGLAQSSYRPPLTPETFIKLAVALGILRLDEPRKPYEIAVTQFINEGLSVYDGQIFLGAIERAGLMIVEK